MKTVTANLRHTAYEKITGKNRVDFMYRNEKFRAVKCLNGAAFQIYKFDYVSHTWSKFGAPVAFSCFGGVTNDQN